MAGAWMVVGRPCGLCSVAVELQTIEKKRNQSYPIGEREY